VDELSFVRELIKQTPALAAFVLMVFSFISYLRSRDESDERREAVNRKFIKELGDSCHSNHATVSDKMAKSVDENTEATDRLRNAIERMNK
jgi:hypothetical protein